MPATSVAIPTVTTSPSSLTEFPFGEGATVDLFFNVEPGFDVNVFLVFLVAPGETRFVSFVRFILACGGQINSPGPGGATFAMSCGILPLLPPGAFHFATLTMSSGAVGDDVTLRAGSEYGGPLNDTQCAFPIGNVGGVVVEITPIPEPASWLLLGVGLAALAALRRRT